MLIGAHDLPEHLEVVIILSGEGFGRLQIYCVEENRLLDKTDEMVGIAAEFHVLLWILKK
jgi:hypothetical protein